MHSSTVLYTPYVYVICLPYSKSINYKNAIGVQYLTKFSELLYFISDTVVVKTHYTVHGIELTNYSNYTATYVFEYIGRDS